MKRVGHGTTAALAVVVVLVLAMTGCVGGRTMELGLEYDPGRAPVRPFEDGPSRVVLVPFEAAEGIDTALGAWVGVSGRKDTIVSSRPVGEAVTGAVRDYLEKTGFTVETAEPGTDPADYPSPPPDLVISGMVEGFEVYGSSQLGSTTIEATLVMRAFVRNVADGSTLTVTIEGAAEPKTVVAFDSGVFEDTATDVLSDAVERLFSSSVLRDGVLRPGR